MAAERTPGREMRNATIGGASRRVDPNRQWYRATVAVMVAGVVMALTAYTAAHLVYWVTHL